MSKILLAIALPLASLLASPLAEAVAWQAKGKRYALLVGVEVYEHRSLREPMLKYSVDDVKDLGSILQAAGYQVTLMTDDTGKQDVRLRPTRENIETKMRSLLRQCRSNDTIVLAFAGHGLQFASQPDAYFCPVDARPFADEADSLVPISKIYRELERSFAGVKVVFVDACRNDPDPGRGRGLDADSAPQPPRGVGALFSCSAGQRAFEHDSLGHGVFFHYVLEGLRNKAKDSTGEVTFEGLALYVRRNVPRRVASLFPMRQQLPNLKADLIGAPPVLISARSERSRPPSVTSAYDGDRVGSVRDDNALKLKMVWCPASQFTMGSSNPVDVTLSHGFWLGRTEITQRNWERVMNSQPWAGKFYFREGRDYPAGYINWEDAVEFCQKLTDQERTAGRLPSDWEYRLPTEAQWEYACRAETTTAYSFGDDFKQLVDHGWFAENAGKVDEQYAHLVGQKTPNPWGFHDMHGNVSEWCRDSFAARPKGGLDPHNEGSTSAGRVTKGGHWFDTSLDCRSANRRGEQPVSRYNYLGFRVVTLPVEN